MNKLKAIFIGIYPMLAMAGLFVAVQGLFADTTEILWWGLLLINIPILFLIAKAYIGGKTARTTPNLYGSIFVATLGFALAETSLILSMLAGSVENFDFYQAITIVTYVSVLLYVFWYSTFGRVPSKTIVMGEAFPPVTFEDSEGNKINTASLIGSPTVYLFFRGNWCPLCMAQISELAGEYKRLQATGTNVVLVSPQSHKKTASLASKHNVDFKFLTDPNFEAAKELGIFMKNGLPLGLEVLGYDSDTLYPTIVVTNKQGAIIFHDQTDNYRVRPEPDVFLKIIESVS